MSREKQIEEMAKVLEGVTRWEEARLGYYRSKAVALYNAGYRKASEVAREIVQAADGIINLICAMTGIEITAVGGKYLELRKKYTEEN